MNSPINSGEIRVIAPALCRLPRETRYAKAEKALAARGFSVSYGKNINSDVFQGTGSVEERVEDLQAAFADPQVVAVMALNGGWSCNELLPAIDWKLLKENPKPFVGYSDNTILANAIYAMTGQIAYVGPNFGTLGYVREAQYTMNNLLTAFQSEDFSIQPSQAWGEKYSSKIRPTDWKVVNSGEAQGTVIGGNMGSLYLLQGTPYMPKFTDPTILVIEDDDLAGDATIVEFDRRLESILQLPDARKAIKAIVVGRFQPSAQVDIAELKQVIERKGLGEIPVVIDVDFGHTLPTFTLPIGGQMKLSLSKEKISIEMLQ